MPNRMGVPCGANNGPAFGANKYGNVSTTGTTSSNSMTILLLDLYLTYHGQS